MQTTHPRLTIPARLLVIWAALAPFTPPLAAQTAPEATVPAEEEKPEPVVEFSPEWRTYWGKVRDLNERVKGQYDTGRYREALPDAKEAVRICREVLRKEHSEYTDSLDYLGMIYVQLGDYAKAEPILEEKREIDARVQGEEHVLYANNLNGLGMLHYLKGDYAKAEPLLIKALELRRKGLGKWHPMYLLSVSNLAMLYQTKGDYAKAEPLHLEALEIKKESVGEKHPEYIGTAMKVAEFYKAARNYPKAESLYLDLIRMFEKSDEEEKPTDILDCEETFRFHPIKGEPSKPESGSSVDPATKKQLRGGADNDEWEFDGGSEPLDDKDCEAILKSVVQNMMKGRKTSMGKSHPGYSLCLNNLGMLYAEMHEYAKAESCLAQAVEIRKRLLGEKHPYCAVSLSNLAMTYQSMGDYVKAEPLLLKALEIQKECSGEKDPAYSVGLNNLAVLYQAKGDYVKAEAFYLESHEIREERLGKKHPGYAQSLNNLAMFYQAAGDYARAEPLQTEALKIQTEIMGENHPVYAMSLNNLALIHQSKGDYAEAERCCLKARELQEKILDEEHPAYAQTLNNLAFLYQTISDYGKAEPLHLRAMAIRKKVLGERHPKYMESLNNLGMLYVSMGDYAKAEPLLIRARAVREETLGRSHPEYAQSLNNLAVLYFKMSDFAKAEPLLTEACETRRETLGEDHPEYALSLHNLAAVQALLGDCDKAESMLEEARRIRKKCLGEQHPDYARSLHDIAKLHERSGDYARSEALQVEALKIQTRSLGPHHPDRFAALRHLALLYHHMGNLAKAEARARELLDAQTEFAKETLAHLSDSRARALTSTLCGPDLFLYILRDTPNPDPRAAYQAVWQTRGLLWRTAASRRRNHGQSPEAESLLEKLRETSTQLAQLTLAATKPDQVETRRKRLAELNEEKERLEGELAQVSSAFREERQAAKAAPDDLAALLMPEEAIVEVVRVQTLIPAPDKPNEEVYRPHYDAFVLRRGEDARLEVHWVPLGFAEEMDEAIAAWREALIGETDSQSASGDTLRKMVWDKIEPHLAGCNRVTIVPDGPFRAIPWAALPGREPGACLLEDYALATATTTRQLYAALSEKELPQGAPLLVGDVAYDAAPAGESAEEATQPQEAPKNEGRIHWDPLPQTAGEIDTVSGNWSGGSEPIVLQGAAAGEAALREALPGARYVHLATHEFFADPKFRIMAGQDVSGERLFGDMGRFSIGSGATVTARNPLILSGVVLAGANLPPKTDELGLPTGDDGILTAEEISNLDLTGTELAVLSGGWTGTDDGAAAASLTGAFHLAGARNVVAGLWKVDPAATSALMKLFYHNLWQEKQPPVEALRQAQLTLYRHPELAGGSADDKTTPPRRWAGFILSGPGAYRR